ncbi:VTC domain-containing protein [Bacteroidota bacterium]
MERNMENLQNNNYRYERKFFISNISRIFVENVIHQHPAFFSEIYHERIVNSIYFDTYDFNNFTDNIIGNTNRTKYRIRWYGELFKEVQKPTLEIKIKKGIVGTKKLMPLKSFNIDRGFKTNELMNILKQSELDDVSLYKMHNQIPVILNRYRRKYFQTSDKKFRITVDDNQEFYKIGSLANYFFQKQSDFNNVILELKYEKQFESEAARITNSIPFRTTKSSKYARGVEFFYT